MNTHKLMNDKLKELPKIIKNSSAITDTRLKDITTGLQQAYYLDNFEQFNKSINTIKVLLSRDQYELF